MSMAEDLWQQNGSEGTSSIADMIAETANSFIENEILPGFVYSQEYNMYYNPETGYFYDMKTSLYYHPLSGWLQYNPLTGGYEILKEAEPKVQWKSKRFRRNAIQSFGGDHVDSMDQDLVDACETLFDLIDRVVFLSGDGFHARTFSEFNQYDDELSGYVKLDRPKSLRPNDNDHDICEEFARRRAEDEASQYPPCIRLIDKTDANKLYIITIGGAKIGYSSKCDVCLRLADGIADEHVEIKFVDEDPEDMYYRIECLRKKHPVFLGDQKITIKTPPTRLEHNSLLTIGPFSFDVHIHRGNNTCPGCEPGVLNANLMAEMDQNRPDRQQRRKNHKQEMRSIKERLGLNERTNDKYSSVRYQDRAAKRRKTQGSEPSIPISGNIYSGCKAEPVPGACTSSVQVRQSTVTSLGPENKGFNLLKSMGWTENTGLGKANQGTVDPIESMVKNDKKGLGSVGNGRLPIAISLKDKRRQDIMQKTRQRFEQANIQDKGGSQ